MTKTNPFRALGLLTLLAVSALVLAACGSSSSSSGSSSTTTQASASGTGSAQRTKLRACLQQHGVTLPQRRAGGGGGGYGGPPGGGAGGSGPPAGGGGFVPGAGGGGGFAQRNPKLAAALKACGGGNFRGRGAGGFRLNRTNLNKYVTCVRSHGYNLPSPNFSGKGPVFPASIRTNAKFLAASKACQSLLVPTRPGGTSSTTTSSTKSA